MSLSMESSSFLTSWTKEEWLKVGGGVSVQVVAVLAQAQQVDPLWEQDFGFINTSSVVGKVKFVISKPM